MTEREEIKPVEVNVGGVPHLGIEISREDINFDQPGTRPDIRVVIETVEGKILNVRETKVTPLGNKIPSNE